jgi:TolB-like protein/class 3 adenylate cyclase
VSDQTDDQTGKRRMAAVMAADVAGYSRLMGADEEATIAALGRARAVFRETVGGHDGRVVDTAGDSVLAIFESIIEAVRCALSVQKTLATRNADVPEDRRMQFRIGVHFGDIVEQGDGTIYGDGVNIAARLEGLAEPGGLTVSGTVHEHIEGRLGIGLADLGEQEVKNIERPVRAWRVAAGGESTPARPRRLIRFALVAAVAVLVTVVGGTAWQLTQSRDTNREHPAGQDIALTIPTGPKIAVIPFANLSSDPDEEYFSDGLTEDIINLLTNFPGMLVFARNSTKKYKGQDVDTSTIASELGANYVVEGTVRRAEGQLRVTAQVLDASNGTNLWAKTYDRELTASNLMAVQDQITVGIVNAIVDQSGVITKAEVKRIARKPLNTLTGLDCDYMLWAYYDGVPTAEKHLEIRDCLERAVAENGEDAIAFAALAFTYRDEMISGFNVQPDIIKRALEAALRAVELDRDLVTGHYAVALLRFNSGELEAFRAAADRALELSPNSAQILADIGSNMVFMGELDRGATLLEKAIVINPDHATWYHYPLAMYYRLKGDYDTALNHALRLNWGLQWDYINRALIYVEMGRMDEARAEAAMLLEVNPEIGATIREDSAFWNTPEEVVDEMINLLRRAGVDIPDEQPLTN